MDCTIIIPTYNRKKFSDLIVLNITLQTYPFIKEIIVADDGEDSERLVLDLPYKIIYYKISRCTIGEKRNFLVSKATGDYIVNFDTDDFYNPDYISTSIFNLILHDKQVSGSADMIMIDSKIPTVVYKQRCLYLNLLNEATLVFTKGYGLTHKFSNSMSNEGKSFLPELNAIYETPIEDIMVCISHAENTILKTDWLVEKYKENIDISQYSKHMEILKSHLIL